MVSHSLVTAYRQTLSEHLPPGAAVAIALSGGMDSSSLLHVALQHRERWPVSACHVNHGLSERAARWAAFCRRLCRRADVPLTVVCARPPATGGSEEWARAARLQAFSDLPAAAVIAAHHADDQAETVLFRLLRGSGVHGLAAMDTRSTPAGVKILRPWLTIQRADIADYAVAHRLHWVEDEDNYNVSRQRNFLRWHALPALTRGVSDCNARLAAAGRRMRESSQLLHQLAEQDEDAARLADGGFAIQYFRSVGELRTRNWLYHSLVLKKQRFSERLIAEAARQIVNCRHPRDMIFRFKAVALRGWRGALYWQAEQPPPPSDFTAQIAAAAGQTPLAPLGGCLLLKQQTGAGLSPIKVGAVIQLRLRQGGERLTPPGRRTRSVANLLQEAEVAPWQRRSLPFLYARGHLAALPGIAVAAEFAAEKNEPGLVCQWLVNR